VPVFDYAQGAIVFSTPLGNISTADKSEGVLTIKVVLTKIQPLYMHSERS